MVASGIASASAAPYRSARQPTATTRVEPSAASSKVSIDSCFAASMKPQVFTTVTSADGASVSRQPASTSRAASSSASTSLRAQPRRINRTVREAGTGAAYRAARSALTDVRRSRPEGERGDVVGARRRADLHPIDDQIGSRGVTQFQVDLLWIGESLDVPRIHDPLVE